MIEKRQPRRRISHRKKVRGITAVKVKFRSRNREVTEALTRAVTIRLPGYLVVGGPRSVENSAESERQEIKG